MGAFLTGASGAIGQHAFNALQIRWPSSQFLLASRTPERIHPPAPNCSAWATDIRQEFELPQGIDIVIHMAGEKRDTGQMEAVNSEGTRRLVLAAKKAGVRRFVHLSSAGVYGAKPHSGTVTERSPHAPMNVYEQTKDAGERHVRHLCPSLGIEYVILQPTNVLALTNASYPLRGLIAGIRRDQFAYFGRRDPWVNYVAVEDVAAAIVFAADAAPPNSTYIINTPAPLCTFVRWIVEELGVDLPTRRLPEWLGRWLGRAGSSFQSATGRPMPFHNERFQELTNTTIYDGSLITRTTHLQYPVGIERFMRNLVRTYIERGLV